MADHANADQTVSASGSRPQTSAAETGAGQSTGTGRCDDAIRRPLMRVAVDRTLGEVYQQPAHGRARLRDGTAIRRGAIENV
jgi:hypothetical protein